ncbi:dUTP diphosphatase [Corynespora cassiicola Philippines]|uniref:Deoxyuridine 5'-triphosphate nucleotidohydrolase n=1 Tax=Corynespora cassiicola Philippines TaxID=1448308 RepID=A0A2T2NDB6_CORCC|nr:dUTP diphosphatase [Corynespora cassiicola Philippines]
MRSLIPNLLRRPKPFHPLASALPSPRAFPPSNQTRPERVSHPTTRRPITHHPHRLHSQPAHPHKMSNSTPSTTADETSTPAPIHEPPSLPSSPLPKRTKVLDPTPFPPHATLPRGTDSGSATPTPLAMASETHPTHPIGSSAAPLQPPAPIAPSIAAAAAAEQQLQVRFLSDKARAPTKGSAFSAGHDLYSAVDVVIPARGRAKVDTDIAISVPVGTYGRVAPRSGLAAKHGIDTMAGVIDSDYRGPVGVILANLSETDFEVKVGDRIAQLIVEKIAMPDVVVVETLEETVRGAGGFGSTGGFGAATVNGV